MIFRFNVLVVSFFFATFALTANCRSFAGTTGGLSGSVTSSASRIPVADAKVTVTSPSQTVSVVSDANGKFVFVSLAPDTYTLSVTKLGFNALSVAGITVQADAQQTLAFSLQKALAVIGRVASRSDGDLVKPGTTADVYAINAAAQERASVLGGGGNLNSAYSAIATVPGAYVPANQSGYNQAVHIRGGDSDQVGYEFDGIPVNRGFDGYPSSAVSSLGQKELQVYTGASPANSEAQGLAGFINQVVKTGTYPSTINVDLGVGGPAFYHSLNVEAGGANAQRTLSYYVGLGGYTQDHRYIDQFGGSSYVNTYGPILFGCPTDAATLATLPSCSGNGKPYVGQAQSPGYALGPISFGSIAPAQIGVRTTVANFHIGLPHRNGMKDDIQLLYDNDQIFTTLLSSPLDEGLANVKAYTGGSLTFPYSDTWQYTGVLGGFLPNNYTSLVQPYLFPSSPRNRAFQSQIPINDRDRDYNVQSIVKLQYQKNFSPTAYARIYGYTYYSNYIDTGEQLSYQPYDAYDGGDYEIASHTRGVSASLVDQISSQHLLEFQTAYTTSNSKRIYNEQPYGYADAFAVLVNPADISSGTCYTATPGTAIAAATTCQPGGGATFASLAGIGTRTGLPPAAGAYTCGGATCRYFVAENGAFGQLNAVTPAIMGYSITDQFKPTDKLLLNLGLRLDRYRYAGADTTQTPARAFWFNAFNNDLCLDTATGSLVDKTQIAPAPIAIGAPCSTANVNGRVNYRTVTLQNVPRQSVSFNVLQPRLGASYTVNPDTVLRASYGKYNEQPTAAYEQYDSLQQNLPGELAPFYGFGFHTPSLGVRPSISYNYDASLEHRFRGTNVSLKFTPFYRQTRDQIENFYLDYKADFFSGFNVGQQTSRGFEFALNTGNFERDGLSSQLSFAYTNSYVKYQTLANGGTIVSPINADIANYNALTSACAPRGKAAGSALCGATASGVAAAPCYATSGQAVAACTNGDVANPYWNAPPQPLLDPGANYVPYATFPGGVGTGVNGFNFPYVATLLLNYKHGRFAVSPSLQFQAGNRYGAPETTPGIDPTTCTAVLASPTAGDPRYAYGAAGGAPYASAACGQLSGAIPDSYTGRFDNVGAFRAPAQLLGNLRFSYDVSRSASLVVTLANVIDRCFGGQRTAFTYNLGPQVCSYSSLTNAAKPVGNVYDPGDNVQPFLRYPYEPTFGAYNDLSNSTLQPFGVYVNVRLKI